MLLELTTDTSSPITNPSSENLLTLIIITGGLLFICIVLLIIVVLRSKARRRKSESVVQPVQTNEVIEAPEVKKVVEVVKPVIPVVVAEKKVEPKKEVIEVVIKNEPVPEMKKEEVIKPVVIEAKIEVKKEIEVVKEEKKIEPVVQPEPVKIVETKKPDEVIIKIEEKKFTPNPLSTTVEQKKEEFRKALEETHSKEDNLRLLQERLKELSKEKNTTVSFTEPEKKVEPPKVEEKKEPVEHTKLVDLTALINSKLQGTNEEKESVEKPKAEEKKIEQTEEEKSHQILTPFFDKIKSNEEETEKGVEPVKANIVEDAEVLINEIEENIKKVAEKEIEKTNAEKPKENIVTQKEEAPKTFTEWLNTLKK